MSLTKDGRHRFKWMKYRGTKVAIDVDIAPLCSKLWRLGIRTTNSCQGHCSFDCNHKTKIHPVKKDGTQFFESIKTNHCNDCVWIVFESALDVEMFYNAVAEYVPYKSRKNSMYAHIKGYDRKKYPRDIWSLRFYPRNYGITGHWGRPKWGNKRSTRLMWIEDGCDENYFIIQPQLTFPRKHLPYVEEKLKQALRDKRKK
jgi:hypothetical protein